MGTPVEECQRMISKSLQTKKGKFLKESMEKAGCRLGDNFIKAVNCANQVAGGYIKGKGIVVCSNYIRRQDDVNQVVFHELIHAYDECRAANLNWQRRAHQACSEIRANHLSGDCHFKREFLRGNWKLKGQGKECVKRRAILSCLANSYAQGGPAKDVVEAVWDTCYNDTQPFDRAP